MLPPPLHDGQDILQADQTGELEKVTEGSFGNHEGGVQIVGKDIGEIVVIEAQE